jgi:tripartite ATP-independent transporter DctP family solute receptor
MRKLVLLVMCAVLVFGAAQSAMAAKTYKMKLHSVGSETHQAHQSLLDFEKYVEENTDGGVEVSLHINAALGGDRQATEAMQLGTVECGIIGTSTLATFAPRYNVFDLPFAFKDFETANEIIDGPLSEILEADLEPQGLRIIGWGVNGFRNVSNNEKPIHTPADMEGMKIRCMENPIHIATFKAMGANPTPMSFSELYTALAQGTVDGQDNPVVLTYSSKFYEVQDYYSLTGHIFAVAPLVMSEAFFQSLPEEYQEVVLEAGKRYEASERAATKKQRVEMLELLKETGMQVNALTDEERALFVEATAPVYDEFEDVISTEIMEIIREGQK